MQLLWIVVTYLLKEMLNMESTMILIVPTNFVYIRRSGTLQQIWCLSSNLSRRWILRVFLFVILQAFFSTVYEGGKFLRSHGGSRILRSIGIK